MQRISVWILSTILLAAGGAAASTAETPPDTAGTEENATIHELETMVVRGRADDLVGIANSASQGYVGPEILSLRPLLRVGELLETVPGMIVTQHSGTGKGNQMFLRGFNLDHGTDFRTEVEGMPVNLPTNAHGQGYTDLNFVIPEFVDHLVFKKGVYYAEVGDFSGAGSARMELRRRLQRNFVRVEAGEFAHRRAVAGVSVGLGAGDLLLGGELHLYDGPWDLPESVDKINGLARYTWQNDPGDQEFSLLALAYDNSWDSTDQVPQRAIDSGLIGRLGNIDPTCGGNASRYSLSGSWRRQVDDQTQTVEIYGYRYEMQLFSNFTYLLADPVNGDQFEQFGERTVAGLQAEHRWEPRWFGRANTARIGFQSRSDIIDEVSLHQTRRRVRLSTVRSDEVFQTLNGAYAELRTDWSRRWRSLLGLRFDHYHFDVTSDRPENSGTASSALASPKATLAWQAAPSIELYLNGGFGFHSNDARGTTISIDPATDLPAEPVDPLVRAAGAELGVRVKPTPQGHSTLSFWWLDLDSELLYVGDAGATEASDGSRRYGLELANYLEPTSSLALDLDLSFSRARFRDVPAGQDFIPGALENVITAGATWRSPAGPFCALRLRHLGRYPLNEDDTVRAAATNLVNLGVGWRFATVELGLDVLNLFDAEDNDIQYYYASRLEGEPAGGFEDVHVHPVEPRSLRGRLIWRF
jgi:hypothetical protein